MNPDDELLKRAKEDLETGALEECIEQFSEPIAAEILENMKLMAQDVRRYGWQYLSCLNELKCQGYDVRPLEDCYLKRAHIMGFKPN